MTSVIRKHGLLLGLLTFLALLATWPLVSKITTHVPGSDTWAYDEYTFIWSMWWFKYSLLDPAASIFFSPQIFYPLGMELILYSYNLMAAILALPLGLATNWAFTSNIMLLFSIVMSGYGAYLLATWLMRGRDAAVWAGLIAAVIYAYASNRAIYLALGHYNIHSVQYLPFFALYLLRLMAKPTRHDALMLGIFGAFNLLVDMQYGVFMAFLALCLLLTKPLRPLLFRDEQAKQRWLMLLAAGAVILLLTLPYFWQTVKSFFNADFLLSGWGDALKLSADLAGWFAPTALHPLFGTDWVQRLRAVQEGTAPFRDVNTVFLGYVTLILVMVGSIVFWRRLRGWILAAILAALFTLGPLLQIFGEILYDFDGLESSVPMPFLLLHYIPFVKGNRTANRWSIVLLLALAVLATWGALALLERFKGGERRKVSALIAIALAAFIIFEHAAMPLPLTDARIPQAVQELAALPDGAVLQIPMGWRNSFGVLGTERTQAQYYMTAHEKPILSGNTSRNPAIKFDYFGRLPFVKAITRQEFGEEAAAESMEMAASQADDLMTLWGVRYLMTLPPVPGRYPYADNWQESQQLTLDLVSHDETAIIDDGAIQGTVAVTPGEPLPLRLDFGASNTDAWRAGGWDVDELDVGGASGIWAIKPDAQILFRSENATPRELKMRIAPFQFEKASPQTLTVFLNGSRVRETELAPAWQEVEFDIQPQTGINTISLQFGRVDSPRQALQQAMVGNTGVQSPVNIDIHAFEQAFITLFDSEGNETPASFGRRGYNITVLDAATGGVLDMKGFDTVANSFEVQDLVTYLTSLPEGRLVLIATREGAGPFVSEALVDALRLLGSNVITPDSLLGQAHALVGVVGAAPGSASERIDPEDAFLRIDGDFRTLAAALDWLAID